MRIPRALMVVPIAFALVACGDDDSGGDASSGNDVAFCAGAADLEEKFGELGESDFGDENPGDLFSEVSDEIDNLNPPEEIEDDIDTVVDVLRSASELFGDVDFSDPSNFDEEAFSDVEDDFADLEAASDRIEKYLVEECGISIDEGDDSDSTGEDSGE